MDIKNLTLTFNMNMCVAAVDAIDATAAVDAADAAPAIVVVSAAVVVVVSGAVDMFKTEKEQLHYNLLKQCLIRFASKSNQNYLCTYAILQRCSPKCDRLLHTRVNVGSVK